MQQHYTLLLHSLGIPLNNPNQSARSTFARQYTKCMHFVPIQGLKLNPHNEMDEAFKGKCNRIPELTHIKQYVQGSSVFGVLTAFNQVFISHKDDLPLRNLSDRDWFETGITATQIAASSDVLLVLLESGECWMIALCPIENPQMNITMKDNFRLMKTVVPIKSALTISAAFSGLCFAVCTEDQL